MLIQPLHSVSPLQAPHSLPAQEKGKPILSTLLEALAAYRQSIVGRDAGRELPSGLRRVLALLDERAAPHLQSLGEQILHLMGNTDEPLNDPGLARTVGELLNRPSAQDVRKTYGEWLSAALQASTPLSRNRRAVNSTQFDPKPTDAPVSPVVKGDSEMALRFADALMAGYVDEKVHGRAPIDYPIHGIPPLSTFGLAWAKLSQSLTSEPFATFARTHGIDLQTVVISPRSGELKCIASGRPTTFRLNVDTHWSRASAAVLGAANALAPGHDDQVAFIAADTAPLNVVGKFYDMPYADLAYTGRHYLIRTLYNRRAFPLMRLSTPPHPFRQQQQAAIESVSRLPPQERDALASATSTPSSSNPTDAADKLLAERCGRLMTLKTYPGPVESLSIEVPESSTLGYAQSAFKRSLATPAFRQFAQSQGIDINTVSINPDSGVLSCIANGVRRTFDVKHSPEWAQVAPGVIEAANPLAFGGEAGYASLGNTLVDDVMIFYKETYYYTSDDCLYAYRQLREQGFSAFRNTPDSADAKYLALKNRQRAAQQAATAASGAPEASQALTVASHNAVGDSELAVVTADMMLALKKDQSTDSSRLLSPIAPQSTFGQWWNQVANAFNSQALCQWAVQQRIDTTTLVFNPANNTLKAKVDGTDRVFRANEMRDQFPDFFDALTPLVEAAKVLVPYKQPIMISNPASSMAAPFELVFNFYGGDIRDLSSPGFVQLTNDMKHAKAFPRQPAYPHRNETELKSQQVRLGDSNNRYNLASHLALAEGNCDLNDTFIEVEPDSSHAPKGLRTTRQFITDNGWNVPRDKTERDNMRRALLTPVPQQPPLSNLWGFLSTPIALSPEQRDQVRAVTHAHLESNATLFNDLAPTTLLGRPQVDLAQLLAGRKAQALGQALQTHFRGASTSTSISQWVLTALILDLDPNPTEQRNTIAGFDFMQPANWGLSASALLSRFTRHLIETRNISAVMAPVAAQVLLSGKAPHLLVKELPDTLTYGTPAWTQLCTAVNRIEQLAPGASSTMTYAQVIKLHKVAPLSDEETVHMVRAQMNPIIDWGIINGVIRRSEKDQYSTEQAQHCQQRLSEQEHQTAEAMRFLARTQAPTRRAMALAYLREAFGPDIPYEAPCLRKPNASTAQDRWASIVELYEANQLSDKAWETDDARVPLKHLQAQAGELPNVGAKFQDAIDKDYATRRDHSITAIKALLAKLPVQDRNNLNYGGLSYYSVRESDTGIGQHLTREQGKKGSHGILIRSEYLGGYHDYAVFPDVGVVQKISGLPSPMPLGGTNQAFGKIYDGHDEGPHELPLDFAAFSSASVPREGITSKVIVDPVVPMIRTNGELVNTGHATFVIGEPPQTSAGFFSPRLAHIAETVVDSHFLPKEQFQATQRGHNAFETPEMTFTQRLNFLARMVPGVSSVEDVIEGNYVQAGEDLFIDAIGLVLPPGLNKAWAVGGETLDRIAAAALESEGRGAGRVGAAVADVSAATVAKDSFHLSRLQGSAPATDALASQTRVDIITGMLKLDPEARTSVKTSAVFQDGEWYAYDAQTKNAYGPPLEGFRPQGGVQPTPPIITPQGSVKLTLETNPHGATVRVPESLRADHARLLKRQNYTDVVVGEKVYRYDPKNPEVLTEVGVTSDPRPLTEYQGYCPAPSGRVRRALDNLCFTKWIEPDGTPEFQDAQALEHRRLVPAPAQNGQPATVVHEHRLYQVSANPLDPLMPAPIQTPITYRNQIKGSLINEPDFGFDETGLPRAINNNTVVVQLEQISNASNDARTVRAVKVPYNGATYIVAEGDTGVFFYAELNPNGADLDFYRITANNNPTSSYLIAEHDSYKDIRGFKAKGTPNNEIVILPTLDELVKKVALENRLTPEEKQRLMQALAGLSDEKQREVLLNIQAWGKKLNVPIALAPIQLNPLHTPAGLGTLPAAQQNQFYAQASRTAIDQQFEATGIKWGNQRLPNDLADGARSYTADEIVTWLYTRTNAPNYSQVVMKVGAGNCDQMARVAVDTINLSGGQARIAQVQGHTFAVVGGQKTGPYTQFFSEPDWADAWVVDPWAEITCPARDYRAQFMQRMQEWSNRGKQIMIGDGGTPPQGIWVDPMSPAWTGPATSGQVEVF